MITCRCDVGRSHEGRAGWISRRWRSTGTGAVREVLGGSPIGEVAERFGTSRQSLHAWRRRFEAEGVPGLVDRSRRPKSSPSRLDAEVETMICQLRREVQ